MSLQFNQLDINDSIENIFIPQTRVEVAFNLNDTVPVVLPTHVLSCSYKANRMILYQTHPHILSSFEYETMDVATLVQKELNRVVRLGLKCRIEKFLNNYPVTEKIRENLLLVEYFPPMRKINLRTTYRLQTSYRFNVQGKIRFGGATYDSKKHFRVQDISVTGIGLSIPKELGEQKNPAMAFSVGDNLDIELTLEQVGLKEQTILLRGGIQIARKAESCNVNSGFIGARFVDLPPEDQEKLFQYIHEAQLYEIRNFKR
jgi:c-di-GMP-binding flagellar brake protein YcgR